MPGGWTTSGGPGWPGLRRASRWLMPAGRRVSWRRSRPGWSGSVIRRCGSGPRGSEPPGSDESAAESDGESGESGESGEGRMIMTILDGAAAADRPGPAPQDPALDGNAIGGRLIEVFGTELTTALSVCASCGTISQEAELPLTRPSLGAASACRAGAACLLV